MAPLTRELELLASAVSYGLAGAALVTPQLLARPTPCRGWDLETLLYHVGDSIETLTEAIETGSIDPGYARSNGGLEADGVKALRCRAAMLLGACSAASAAEGVVVIGGREVTRRKVALAAAIEVTVHGWDIQAACGAFRPVPPLLACVLLPLAPLLVTPAARAGLFADPIQLPGPACPGDQLVAFLGRQPGWTAPPYTA
jgi:uncharacterized protein (TIGR03086 family)